MANCKKDEEESRQIGEHLLEKKIVACVNLVKDIESSFWWQGKIDKANESLLMVKTKRSCFDDVVREVKQVHSYDVPEIIALPIVQGSQDYLNWIDDNVK